MRATRGLMVVMALLASVGCGAQRSRTLPQPDTTVRVENGNFLGMNVYAVREAGQRVRLGNVPGLSTRVFRIPPSLIFGVTTLRFLADPLGGASIPVTHQIPVTPGDEVVLQILP